MYVCSRFSFCRYILTNRGMHAMYEKYRNAHFGRCPRVFCQGQPVLPVGLSDLPRNYTVNVFCPRCHGLFFPKSTRQANIDGAYFGTTFPHLYLMTHPVSNCSHVIMKNLIFRGWHWHWICNYDLRTLFHRNQISRISHGSMVSELMNRVHFIAIATKKERSRLFQKHNRDLVVGQDGLLAENERKHIHRKRRFVLWYILGLVVIFWLF